MPGLVVGEDPLLLLRDDTTLLEACDDTFHRGVEVRVADVLQVLAPGEDGGLVADVREIGPRQPDRLPGDQVEVDVRGERLSASVHLENRLAAGEIRRR